MAQAQPKFAKPPTPEPPPEAAPEPWAGPMAWIEDAGITQDMALWGLFALVILLLAIFGRARRRPEDRVLPRHEMGGRDRAGDDGDGGE